MKVAPFPDKVPTLAELAKLGMDCIDTRGIDYDPKPGSRGVQHGMKVLMWKTTITALDATKPMVVAIRASVEEADLDARLRFVQIMAGKAVLAVSEPPEWAAARKPKPAPKPPVKVAPVAEDDDLDDLV